MQTTAAVSPGTSNADRLDIEIKETPIPTHIARQALLKPRNEFCMDTISVSGIHTVETRILERNRQLTFSAHSVIEVVLS